MYGQHKGLELYSERRDLPSLSKKVTHNTSFISNNLLATTRTDCKKLVAAPNSLKPVRSDSPEKIYSKIF